MNKAQLKLGTELNLDINILEKSIEDMNHAIRDCGACTYSGRENRSIVSFDRVKAEVDKGRMLTFLENEKKLTLLKIEELQNKFNNV